MTKEQLVQQLDALDLQLAQGVEAFAERVPFLPRKDPDNVLTILRWLDRTGGALMRARVYLKALRGRFTATDAELDLVSGAEGITVHGVLDEYNLRILMAQTLPQMEQLLQQLVGLPSAARVVYVRDHSEGIDIVKALATEVVLNIEAALACVDDLAKSINGLLVDEELDDNGKDEPEQPLDKYGNAIVPTNTPTTLASITGPVSCDPTLATPGAIGGAACMREFHDAIHFDAVALYDTLDPAQRLVMAALLRRLTCTYMNLKHHVVVQ